MPMTEPDSLRRHGGWLRTLPALAALLLPVQTSASPAQARQLNSMADSEFEAALSQAENDPQRAATMMRRAASLYWEALRELPENTTNRTLRGDLLAKSISAYRQAHGLTPSSNDLAEPLRITQLYLSELIDAYGDGATDLAEYGRAKRYAVSLSQDGDPISASEPERMVEAPTRGEEDPPHATSTPPLQDGLDRTVSPRETEELEQRRNARPIKISLGVSLGMAGAASIAALGTGLSLVSDPFYGAKYREIYEAFKESGLHLDASGDLCTSGEAQGAQNVIRACAAYDATKRASIAMGITAGVALASAAVSGALLGRICRSERRDSQRRLSIVPTIGLSEIRIVGSF